MLVSRWCNINGRYYGPPMKYRVKLKKGISIFHDKELADKCAKENGTEVEELVRKTRDTQDSNTTTSR